MIQQNFCYSIFLSRNNIISKFYKTPSHWIKCIFEIHWTMWLADKLVPGHWSWRSGWVYQIIFERNCLCTFLKLVVAFKLNKFEQRHFYWSKCIFYSVFKQCICHNCGAIVYLCSLWWAKKFRKLTWILYRTFVWHYIVCPLASTVITLPMSRVEIFNQVEHLQKSNPDKFWRVFKKMIVVLFMQNLKFHF